MCIPIPMPAQGLIDPPRNPECRVRGRHKSVAPPRTRPVTICLAWTSNSTTATLGIPGSARENHVVRFSIRIYIGPREPLIPLACRRQPLLPDLSFPTNRPCSHKVSPHLLFDMHCWGSRNLEDMPGRSQTTEARGCLCSSHNDFQSGERPSRLVP